MDNDLHASMHHKLLKVCDIKDPYSEKTSFHRETPKEEIKSKCMFRKSYQLLMMASWIL